MESIFTNEEWGWLPTAMMYIANALIVFFIGKLIFKQKHKKINTAKELAVEDNFAFAIAYVGYFIGLLMALSGAIIGESYGITVDSINIFTYGILAAVLLNIASVINDKLILSQFSIHKEIIKDHNAGTGLVEAANFIASGLIIRGAISGEGDNFFPEMAFGELLSGVLSVLVFWIVGQILLILITKVYNAILPYNVHDQIEDDNVAAGIGFSGAMIAIAILIGYGISGDFEGWGDHFLKIGVEVLIGIIILPLARYLTDWIFLPGGNLTHEIVNQDQPNMGAGLIEAFAYIGSAFLITICF